MVFNKIKKFLPLIAIIIVASIFRLVFLDRLPTGVVGDELTYLLNAKSIFLTGTDMTGTWNPFSVFLFHYPPGVVQAELPYFLFAPIVGLFPFSLFTAHLTNALLGIATVVVIYFLSKELFGERVAFIAALIASVNPWMVYISRTAYEVVPAAFFYLLGLYILFKTTKWKIFYALPIFLLGFYSYIGMKIIFPLVIFVGCWFAWEKNKRKFSKRYALVCLASLLIVLLYIGLLKIQPGSSRMGELFSFSDQKISQGVNALRNSSLQSPLVQVFDNKFTIGAFVLVQKFFHSLSFDYLFLYGDSFFSLWHHGLFYYLDFVFLSAGFIGAFIFSKRSFFFLTLCILIGFIPELAHSDNVANFTPHIAFIFPFMTILIGAGIWSVIKSVKHQALQKLVFVVTIGLYLFMVGNFVQVYFYQSPIESGYFGFQDRLAIDYANFAAAKNQKVHIYAHLPQATIQRYIFYSNARVSQTQMLRALKSQTLTVGNVTISSCKEIDPSKLQETSIVDYLCQVNTSVHHLTIPQLIDGGEAYGIYQDKICSQYVNRQYTSNLSLADFAVESLSLPNFCNTFITTH